MPSRRSRADRDPTASQRSGPAALTRVLLWWLTPLDWHGRTAWRPHTSAGCLSHSWNARVDAPRAHTKQRGRGVT